MSQIQIIYNIDFFTQMSLLNNQMVFIKTVHNFYNLIINLLNTIQTGVCSSVCSNFFLLHFTYVCMLYHNSIVCDHKFYTIILLFSCLLHIDFAIAKFLNIINIIYLYYLFVVSNPWKITISWYTLIGQSLYS